MEVGESESLEYMKISIYICDLRNVGGGAAVMFACSKIKLN